MPGKHRPIAERWADKVLVGDDCWEWVGGKHDWGYGTLRVGGARQGYRGAHRVAWELFRGLIPDGMLVCHHCDNPGCVKPSHLFLGSPADNMHDKDAKGRSRVARGADQRSAKLDEEDVRAIRSLLADGVKACQLAAFFGVRPNTISNIKHGATWGWLQ